MKFSCTILPFVVCLITTVYQISAVEMYNALSAANVLIQYSDSVQSHNLILVDLSLSDEGMKLRAMEEADMQQMLELKKDVESKKTTKPGQNEESLNSSETEKVKGDQDVQAKVQQDTLRAPKTPNQTDKSLLRHGREFFQFKQLTEATILYAPEDVECYFFYITLNKRLMPEQSFIKFSRSLRPFRRVRFGEQPLHFVAVECEGSVYRKYDVA